LSCLASKMDNLDAGAYFRRCKREMLKSRY
jgi:hypothetical protein